MQTVNEIRGTFLDYFAENGHEIMPSSSLVPVNDPTLMFTNAGMVQFKNVFTGLESLDYNRAVTSQKCVRAGGKHNDLENVGYTARHHTFFEMLGNFSFGDYFKDVAIELAWKLITDVYGLPPEKLLVTVHTSDEDAAELWKKIAGLDDRKIIRIPTSDNFWSMGDTGPCGPCSEIFYDHGDHIPGGPPGSPDEDGDRFIEIWNLVFMQFEQVSPDVRNDLPRPSIDTGMGLERISAVLQGTHDNYETDLFKTLIAASADLSRVSASGEFNVSHRVIADHLRASSFLIADGVLPSNEGRGYVLRRIMRRAMRHVQLMGCKDALMWRLVPTLVREMGQAFPELVRGEPLITETLKLEEGRFKKTLDKGLKLLDEASANLGEGGVLPGETAFKLYDTYGFPLDLTEDALRNKGMTVDHDGFNKAMEQQRADARKAWAGSGDAATEAVWFELRDRLGATEFLGYETETAEARVTALIMDDQSISSVTEGDTVGVLVNQTPFYALSGGQMGDKGVITSGNGVRIRIDDTLKKAGDLHLHQGIVEKGTLHVGDEVRLEVDGPQRAALRANHSATHLLHEALRQHLGDHVTQKGSLVAPDRLRFDISHPKPVDGSEIENVEADVNAQIMGNSTVVTRLMDQKSAIEAGAMALFGEKYGDEVRVVSMGSIGSGGSGGSCKDGFYSTELCGGTHVKRTGDIGVFKVLSESAVAAGVRRIEAVTGNAARHYFGETEHQLLKTAEVLKTKPADVPDRVLALIDERRKMEQEISSLRKQIATGGSGGDQGEDTVNGIKIIARKMDGMPAKDLKGLADDFKNKIGSGVIALLAVNDGKASLVVAVTDDLTDTFNAVDLVRVGSAVVGGKGGGGRPDMAQAGGPDGDQAGAALDAIKQAVAKA